MVMTRAAQLLGLLDYLAGLLDRSMSPRSTAAGSQAVPWRAFAIVFVMGCVTASVLNNDAAILLLTPIVVALVRRRYRERPELVMPFAFAVFLAAGVAPLVTSNPINLVVAGYAGIEFNEYASRMIPVSVVGWAAALVLLYVIFGRQLAAVPVGGTPPSRPRTTPALSGRALQALVLLAASLAAYPVMSYFGGPLWMVAAVCAVLGICLCWHHRTASPVQVVGSVSWEILLFLFCVFVIVLGLQNVGLVAQIAGLYQSFGGATGQIAGVGITSALGSAIINNHPMAMLNALALDQVPGVEHNHFLAALIGGDLGPRLLPTGSLAGLLWIEALRREGIHVRVWQFCLIGAVVTIPSLLLSLLVLLA
jgi:arsenical pump membrane protein